MRRAAVASVALLATVTLLTGCQKEEAEKLVADAQEPPEAKKAEEKKSPLIPEIDDNLSIEEGARIAVVSKCKKGEFWDKVKEGMEAAVKDVNEAYGFKKDKQITMTFEAGVPKTLNGKAMKVSEIITELNALGGKHGIGIIDIVENRVVGMKSRGVYETPGGTILYEAHQQLEELVLDRATYEVKEEMGNKLSQVVYEGKWFTPLREAIQAFIESTQEYVTGEVKFKLYKGNIIKAGTTSPYSLYSESLASFTTGDLYDHHDADGFINLFGLPLKVRAMKMAEVEGK